jgi:hypothetical protein
LGLDVGSVRVERVVLALGLKLAMLVGEAGGGTGGGVGWALETLALETLNGCWQAAEAGGSATDEGAWWWPDGRRGANGSAEALRKDAAEDGVGTAESVVAEERVERGGCGEGTAGRSTSKSSA